MSELAGAREQTLSRSLSAGQYQLSALAVEHSRGQLMDIL